MPLITGFPCSLEKLVWKIDLIIIRSWKMVWTHLHGDLVDIVFGTLWYLPMMYNNMASTVFPSHYQDLIESWPKCPSSLRDLCPSRLWKFEMENIWQCCNDVGEYDTLDNPWTIKCRNSPKDSQRPLPVKKLCLGPALSIRKQQHRASDKRSLASFVVHCTSSRQPLLWAVM